MGTIIIARSKQPFTSIPPEYCATLRNILGKYELRDPDTTLYGMSNNFFTAEPPNKRITRVAWPLLHKSTGLEAVFDLDAHDNRLRLEMHQSHNYADIIEWRPRLDFTLNGESFILYADNKESRDSSEYYLSANGSTERLNNAYRRYLNPPELVELPRAA